MATAAIIDPSIVHADIAQRIDRIAREARSLPVAELCRRADTLRNLAATRQLLPLARLAGGLRDMLAGGGRGMVITPWVDAMRESLAADAQDEAAARAFVASVGIRLAG